MPGKLTRPLRYTLGAALLWAIVGCSPSDAPAVSANAPSSPEANPLANDARLMRLWSRSCALCHVDGTGGAPVIGDHAAWQPRVAGGEEALLAHTVEGYNNMPPLGYCMACERADLLSMIRFMTSVDSAAHGDGR